jgi:hypothetical protein
MIQFAQAALGGQRPFVAKNRKLLKAFGEGMRGWRKYYGELLTGEIGAGLEHGDLQKAGTAMLALVGYNPRAVVLSLGTSMTNSNGPKENKHGDG